MCVSRTAARILIIVEEVCVEEVAGRRSSRLDQADTRGSVWWEGVGHDDLQQRKVEWRAPYCEQDMCDLKRQKKSGVYGIGQMGQQVITKLGEGRA
jgi:hypothetical protein